MRKSLKSITCGTRNFNLVVFEIDPVGEDAILVSEVLNTVKQHGAVSYNPSGKRRSEEELTNTRYLGVLSEKLLVNHFLSELGPDVHISNKAFVDYDAHVDIEIQVGGKITPLEVRSSFPYSNLKDVVCRYFNVIGPYVTSYKRAERPKDFYLLGLINEAVGKFNFEKEHKFYLAGGASYQLLKEKGKRDNLKQQGADYLVMPLVQAMDAVEIVDVIRSEISAV